MLYRQMGKTGDKVSILGYGCMRFPKNNRKIDEKMTEEQITFAIEQGVNYFDTAYIYPDSEEVLGKILAKGFRDKVMIASKLPSFMIHSHNQMEDILNIELRRLQTNHIDYYLMHSLINIEGWQRLKSLGVENFIDRAKKVGKIKHIGFSFHGNKSEFKQIVNDYPWEFCQIQYNYMDKNNQAGREGIEYASSKGLGISIMEPLRGGLLVKKNHSVEAVFHESGKKWTPAEWALRFVWNHPEVSVVLSGMNSDSQVRENIRIASNAKPNSLSSLEIKCIYNAKTVFAKKIKVWCTGCGYCLPCPAGVNIPLCFSYYNDRYIYDDKSIKLSYMGVLSGVDGTRPSYASLCKGCGKCEKYCPQHIQIRDSLNDVSKEMENF